MRERLGRRGYELRRAPLWHRTHPACGGYMIVKSTEKMIVAGYEPFAFSLDLDAVADWLRANARN
jgi:hypothetical protein